MPTQTQQQFKVHTIVGVDNTVSLQKLGTLSATQLATATAAFTDCDPMGWNADITPDDMRLGTQYNFDAAACITDDEDFVLFGFSKSDERKIQLDILAQHYPDAVCADFGVLCCDSYFAHSHNDKDTTKSSGQLMFVIDNTANHLLYSKDAAGVEHTFVPQKGDIVFLDVWCDHAVLPDQSKGLDFMRQHGMKLVCFAVG